MASLSRRNSRSDVSAWPGWVDSLSSLVMVVIFLLMIFVVAQFYLATAITGRDEQLHVLNGKVAELNDILAMQKQANTELGSANAQLTRELAELTTARDTLDRRLATTAADLEAARKAAEEMNRTVTASRETIELKLKEIISLQNDLKALREARQSLEGQVAELVTARRLLEDRQTEQQKALQDQADTLAATRKQADVQQRALQAQLDAAQGTAKTLTGQLDDLAAARKLSEEQRQALLAELGVARDRSKALEAQVADAKDKTMLAQKTIDARDIRLADLEKALAGEKKAGQQGAAQIDLLNQQIALLRKQLAEIGAVLEASEKQAAEQKVQIAELGARLNQALASKVQELARYRSEFFGRVREALGNRPDVRIVGDRFVFQSELLFPTASASLEEGGKQRLAHLARTLVEIGTSIPGDINWVLRVDGHTDQRPISTPQFPSNWELSAARAIAVVKYLSDQGIPAERLAAAGFGEFQPLDPGRSEEALARNRRIEIKLDQR